MVYRYLPCEYSVVNENLVNSNDWDVVCVLDRQSIPPNWIEFCEKWQKVDKGMDQETIMMVDPLNACPLIYSPVGEITDFHDVRVYEVAAGKAMARAIMAGARRILLRLPENPMFTNAGILAILGAFRELYVPLQMREQSPLKRQRIERLGLYYHQPEILQTYTQIASFFFSGMFIAKDIGGGDPERMAAPNVVSYVRSVFPENGPISMTVISGHENFERDYPLFAAVNRAANTIERHQGRIIYLDYVPPETAHKTIILVGKGVTYDTGGADIKANGVMAGMSRDKCGAAAVAGFMRLIQETRPSNIRCIGVMCMVRNSVGEDAYVSDELITANSGVVVRVGNTDAEGRMAMADALGIMRKRVLEESMPDAHLFTIATLTGHAFIAYGEGYSIAMDNGPARAAKHAERLQENGEHIGDPIEISTIRSEDFKFNSPKQLGEDIVQANNLPSSRTPRGHQSPAAFLMTVSGIDKHGVLSNAPIKYTHLDIAGSAGEYPEKPTGAPIRALFTTHISPTGAVW